MVTWSSTALVLLQSKYSLSLAHAAPLFLSLSLSCTRQLMLSFKWIKLTLQQKVLHGHLNAVEASWRTGSALSAWLWFPLSAVITHLNPSLSLSVTHTHLKVFRTFVKWKIDFSCLATCNFGMQMAERKTATNAATAADTDTQIQIHL